MNYDIIGDIHGHDQRLEGLLKTLGYRKDGGAWRYPGRQVIFVGDFVDRGRGQLATLRLVRDMVDAGSALALMGNHEFNAIAWHTEDPNNPGRHLRLRYGDIGEKNRKQHRAFLEEFEHNPGEHKYWIDWFYTLPLWLEFPALRVVHACWDETSMQAVQKKLGPGNRMTPELLVSASRRGSSDYRAVETVLKGAEVRLPDGISFLDKDGHERHEVRIRWWDPEAVTYRRAAVTAGASSDSLPDDPIPNDKRVSYSNDRPVFFGHYWMTGKPDVLNRRAACVDYSVAKEGPLVAYRWDGESELTSSKLVAF